MASTEELIGSLIVLELWFDNAGGLFRVLSPGDMDEDRREDWWDELTLSELESDGVDEELEEEDDDEDDEELTNAAACCIPAIPQRGEAFMCSVISCKLLKLFLHQTQVNTSLFCSLLLLIHWVCHGFCRPCPVVLALCMRDEGDEEEEKEEEVKEREDWSEDLVLVVKKLFELLSLLPFQAWVIKGLNEVKDREIGKFLMLLESKLLWCLEVNKVGCIEGAGCEE